MRYALIGQVYNKNSEKYRLYALEAEKFIDVTIKELLALGDHEAKFLNFRVSASKTRLVRLNSKTSYLKSVIKDSNVISGYYTLVGVSDDGSEFELIKCTGEKKLVSPQEYLEIHRELGINNETVVNNNVVLEEYNKKCQGMCLFLDINEKGNRESNEGNRGNTINYKDILFNMYPYDRITIKNSEFSCIGYSTVKILDSNFSGTQRITLCKLFKDKAKINYTLCIVDFNDESETCRVEVLGQSDIPSKRWPIGIDKICIEYAAWRRSTKFIRIGD